MATTSTVSDYPFLKLLSKLPHQKASLIYKSSPACLFTLNMLDSSARDIVNFLMTTPPINLDEICMPQKRVQVRKILELLTALKIVYLQDELSSICPNFRQSMIGAMTIRQRHTTKFERMKDGKDKIKILSVTDLCYKGFERWDTVLKYLIKSGAENIGLGTINMFLELKYTNQKENGKTDITSRGFQFLLLSRHAQIWTYVSAYLRHMALIHPDHAHDIIDIFCSLVMLAPTMPTTVSKSSFFIKTNEEARFETPYRIPTFGHTPLNDFFLHLRELGFIYIRKRKDGNFYITPMLAMLRSTGSVAVDAAMPLSKSDGYLVVESNYRVYAYTNDQLQLSILNTFTDADGAFADMIMAIITRNSVRRAFELGITANQIVAFMRANSHPIAIEKFGSVGCVPQTVVDQIELWEIERTRFHYTHSLLYSNFSSQNEFHIAQEFAKGAGIHKWSNAHSRQLVIDESGHDKFKQWWATYRQRFA